ncbi:MAG: nuclear transport factor 2 family protein [Elusimicrobia bacterium]|nr:nuclear transport factor 2 family protein [Elusimicrobiota bacterium]
MMGRAALLIFLAAAPARAAGCLGALAGALTGSAKPPALSCFAPDASWLDEAGVSTGPASVRAGLARLASAAWAPKGLAWRRLSTGTWLLTGLRVPGTWAGPEALVAVDLAGAGGFFAAARVYRAARPWPADAPDQGPAWTAAQAAAAFNGTFARGDVPAWAAQWAPDARFISVVGPYEGKGVAMFFRKQAERYADPRMTPSRDEGPAPDGSLVMEGTISGRCRSTGSAFAFPYLMLMRRKSGRLSFVYEAFATYDDGCGPYWAVPH